MKKRYFLFLLAFVVTGLCAMAQSKLDFEGFRLVNQYKELIKGEQVENLDLRLCTDVATSRAANVQLAGENIIGAVVELADGAIPAELEIEGVEIVQEISPDIYIVSLPVKTLEEFSELPAVRIASVGDLKKTSMNHARAISGIDDVHKGTGLDRAYKGKDVVVGIFDTGLQPSHINFRYRDNLASTRVKEARAYTGSNGKPTRTATTETDILNFGTDMTSETHGTHCLGIAAGSYNGVGTYTDNGTLHSDDPAMPLYGNAPEAEIILGGGQLYDANILAGVKDVINYAKSVNKPAVINLSLGSLYGEKDGKSSFSKSLAELGKEAIICVATGNDGGEKNSFRMTGGLQATNQSVGFTNYVDADKTPHNILISNSTSDVLANLEFVIVDVTTGLAVYTYPIGNTNGSYISLGGSTSSSSYTHPSEAAFGEAFTSDSYVRFRSFVNSANSKFTIEVTNRLKQGTNTAYKPGIRFTRAAQTRVYGVNSGGEFTNYAITTTKKDPNTNISWTKWTDGTDDGSVSSMATGENIVAVGAYTSQVYFSMLGAPSSRYSYNGHSEVGQVAPFSSYGENWDTQEVYPHVCAPGTVIISSVSSYCTDTNYSNSSAVANYNGETYYWENMQGTSMATPFVTGAVALMLEADPGLTVNDVKDILKTSAKLGGNQTSRATTQAELNKQWGSGQLQAKESVVEVLERKAAGIGGVFEDDNSRLLVVQTDGQIEVYVAGETNLTATLHTISGAQAAKAHAADSQVNISTSGLQKGFYILTAQGATGRYSRKVMIR